MINKLVVFLLKLKIHRLAYAILYFASWVLGKKSCFSKTKNNLWIQKQDGIYFIDFTPNYRTIYSDLKNLCSDVFFHSYTPSENDICIDVGAGIGVESYYMSRMVIKGKVFSIEASPSVFNALRLCKEMNNLNNLTVFNLAISNENGYVGIAENNGHHTENSIIRNIEDAKVKIQSMTIDEFLIQNQIDQVDYLKVNIEGAEKLLIQSFNTINKIKHIAISCHDFLGKRTGDNSLFTKRVVLDFLKANNFTIYERNTGIDYKDDWIYGKNKNYQLFNYEK